MNTGRKVLSLIVQPGKQLDPQRLRPLLGGGIGYLEFPGNPFGHRRGIVQPVRNPRGQTVR